MYGSHKIVTIVLRQEPLNSNYPFLLFSAIPRFMQILSKWKFTRDEDDSEFKNWSEVVLVERIRSTQDNWLNTYKVAVGQRVSALLVLRDEMESYGGELVGELANVL